FANHAVDGQGASFGYNEHPGDLRRRTGRHPNPADPRLSRSAPETLRTESLPAHWAEGPVDERFFVPPLMPSLHGTVATQRPVRDRLPRDQVRGGQAATIAIAIDGAHFVAGADPL